MRAARPVRILAIEDSVQDADLAERALRAHGINLIMRRVAEREALLEALESFAPDLVLSDFSLPGFGGLEALDLVRAKSTELPFIFLSGTLGEDRAIEALRHGATDYVLKDHPRRLGPAVERALRQAQERAARVAAEARYRDIIETSEEWFWEMDREGKGQYDSPGVKTLLGYDPESLAGADGLEHLHPEDRAAVTARLPDLAREKQGWRGWVLRWRHADGSQRWLESNAVPLIGDDGELRGWRGADRDVTGRVLQQQKLRRVQRMEGVLSAINALVVRVRDRDLLFHEACRIAVEAGGLKAAWIGQVERDGKSIEPLAWHGAAEQYLRTFREALRDDHVIGTTTTGRALRSRHLEVDNDVRFDPKLGLKREEFDELGVRSALSAPLLFDEALFGVLVLYANEPDFFDAEEIRLAQQLALDVAYACTFIHREERIGYLAYHDPLTGLANQSALLERLDKRLPEPTALCVLDVIGQRAFNEARGRAFGDVLLRDVGRALAARLGTDGEVARLAGEQFALVLHALPPSGALRERLMEILGGPEGLALEVDGEPVRVTLRGGYAVGPKHGATAEALLRAAEAAHSGARSARQPLDGYREEIVARARQRKALEARLKLAVARREFVVHYQPKLSCDGLRVTGAEALVRWQDPERGLVPPNEFISVLEDTDLIGAVGQQVLERALEDRARWLAAGLQPLAVAVNVAAPQLRDRRFVDSVAAALKAAGAADGALELELTESLVMEEPTRSIETLAAVRALGVDVAIDDFGTGYSSLAYLTRLPIAALKIDRAFIRHIADEPQTMALVNMVIGLAQVLRIRTVAEGVEQEDQLKLLRLLRCDEVQGYYFSKPLPNDQFEAWFRARG